MSVKRNFGCPYASLAEDSLEREWEKTLTVRPSSVFSHRAHRTCADCPSLTKVEGELKLFMIAPSARRIRQKSVTAQLN